MADYLDPADLQKWAPTDAASITLTYPGSVWTWSAWWEVLPAVGANGAVISGVAWTPGSGGLTPRDQELQVGVGAAGAETAILTLYARGATSTSPNDTSSGFNYLPFWIDAVPASARLSVRYRSSNSHSYGSGLAAVGYVEKPLLGSRATTTQPIKCLPSGSAAISWVSPADWTYSAWTEVSAAMGATSLLLGPLATARSVNDADGVAELEVGVGAAGAEVPVWSMPTSRHAAVRYESFAMMSAAHGVTIASGSRVAMRYRGTLDAGETNLGAWLHYLELPL